MIIVKLLGGIGNQMFQYATGLSLAYRNNTSLKLDVGELMDRTPRSDFTFRDFELGCFKLQPNFATPQDIAIFFQEASFLKRKIIDLKKKWGIIQIHVEKSMVYEPGILATGVNIYLSGYWQCEKYFMDIRDLICENFSLRSSQCEIINNSIKLTSIIDQIQNVQSVSVHFRRGDYVNNPKIHSIHGITSADYYTDAIKHISSLYDNIHFFLFSDEPGWVIENGRIHFPYTVISKNPAHVDLYLMSLCKHNIIANSSFSWWGAWLNKNPGKVVIAPKKWFENKRMNEQTKDLIPESWLRI